MFRILLDESRIFFLELNLKFVVGNYGYQFVSQRFSLSSNLGSAGIVVVCIQPVRQKSQARSERYDPTCLHSIETTMSTDPADPKGRGNETDTTNLEVTIYDLRRT